MLSGTCVFGLLCLEVLLSLYPVLLCVQEQIFKINALSEGFIHVVNYISSGCLTPDRYNIIQ